MHRVVLHHAHTLPSDLAARERASAAATAVIMSTCINSLISYTTRMYQIVHYLDENGNDLYQAWLDGLRDRVAKVSVIKRVARVEVGLFGDHASVRDGIWELKVDVGAGYRVYYAHIGNMIVLLTSGGDKKSQPRDIKRAIRLLRDWEKRNV